MSECDLAVALWALPLYSIDIQNNTLHAQSSHNKQYVNKTLIYIIKMANAFIPPGAKSVKIYSDGDLICGEKLIDRVE